MTTSLTGLPNASSCFQPVSSSATRFITATCPFSWVTIDGFVDAADGRSQPLSAFDQTALAQVPVEGDFDGGAQAAIVKWFQQIAGWRRQLGALQNFRIGVRRQVYYGDFELIVQGTGYFDTVQHAFELDIHQDQVRLGVDRQPQRVGSRGGGPHHFIPQSLDTLRDVGGHNLLILD